MNDLNSNNIPENENVEWEFCPSCGERLPLTLDEITFCPTCGLNIKKFKDQGYLIYSSNRLDQSYQEKLTEKEINQNIKKPIWSTLSSITLPLLAFVIMEVVVSILFIIIAFLFPNISFLETLINSSYFIIVLSFFEFFFIIIPFISVKKYLKNPKLKNRFGILGIPINQSKINIIKEGFLGLGYAVVGVFLVNFVSLILELVLSFFFDIQGIITSQNPSGNIDSYISSANIIEILLLVTVMIIVVGPSEEIAFRGYTQKGLVRNLGDKMGIIITALIFTVIHLLTLFLIAFTSPISFFVSFILLFFPYFALSLLLGILFYKRNENLVAPIILHGVYNSLTIIFGYIFYNFSIEILAIFVLMIILLMFSSFISYYILKAKS